VDQSESVNESGYEKNRFKSKFGDYFEIKSLNNKISGLCKLCEKQKKNKNIDEKQEHIWAKKAFIVYT
jgi:hypothetical protein